MPEDLIDFTTALEELQMSEAELSNLVARGDLRVIRSGGKPMFRPSDINALKSDVETDQTIIIPASGPTPDPSDSQITIDLPQDVDETAATLVGAEDDDQQSDTGTEEIVFEDSLEVLPLEDEAMATSALTTAGATAIDESEATVVDDDAAVTSLEPDADTAPAPKPSRSRRSKAKSRREPGASARHGVSRRAAAAYDVQKQSPAWSIMLILSLLVLVYVGSILAVEVFYGHSVAYQTEEREVEVPYVPGIHSGAYEKMKDWGEPQQ